MKRTHIKPPGLQDRRTTKLFIITNNPDRASFRQRIAVYIDTLKTNGIDCEVARMPSGLFARRKLFKLAAEFDGEDCNQRNFLLDFEYARFYDKPSIEILMFEAAHSAKFCPDRLKGDTINNWLAKLLDAVEIRDTPGIEKAIGLFNRYRSSGRLSRKERIKIR